ncbi:hypothetical protein EHV15_30165 [Paenibacillus oralis]|uniref:ABC transporter permease n=1 Tax=Paenibacillus oralis TaxID=2490856 RepID=A0A3P3U8M9_9BACL|nr:hypothetical protein [Paenibacillus oralis]RRJ66721.1 hypothetical protein EHV15_30165 [Paenibacillus oralis]
MNILSIAATQIKRDFRDRWTLIFMLAFPIVLMLILGTALAGTFNGTIEVGDIRVLVRDKGENAALSKSFSQEAAQSGITFTPLQAGMDGRKEVEQNRYDDYVELTGSGISLYAGSQNAVASGIVQGMITAFADKYNAVSAVLQVVPGQADSFLRFIWKSAISFIGCVFLLLSL